MKKHLTVFMLVCLLTSGTLLAGCGADPKGPSSENISQAEELPGNVGEEEVQSNGAKASGGKFAETSGTDMVLPETTTGEPSPQIWDEVIEENLRAHFSIPAQVSELSVLDLREADPAMEEIWERLSSKRGTLEVTDTDLGPIYSMTDEEGGKLNWSSGILDYRSKRGWDIRNIIIFDEIEKDPMSERYEKELSALGREEAESQVRETLAWMLPEVQVEEVRLYALSVDTLREYREKLNDPEYYDMYILKPTELRDEWNEEDEVYYFEADFSLNRYPVMDHGFVLPDDTSTKGTNSYGCVGKDGFEYFRLGEMVFQVEGTRTETVVPWEQAYQTIKDHYSLIINTHPLNIDEVSLKYVVMPLWDKSGRATLAPVWCIHVEMEDWPEFPIEEYVNALTGERMN